MNISRLSLTLLLLFGMYLHGADEAAAAAAEEEEVEVIIGLAGEQRLRGTLERGVVEVEAEIGGMQQMLEIDIEKRSVSPSIVQIGDAFIALKLASEGALTIIKMPFDPNETVPEKATPEQLIRLLSNARYLRDNTCLPRVDSDPNKTTFADLCDSTSEKYFKFLLRCIDADPKGVFEIASSYSHKLHTSIDPMFMLVSLCLGIEKYGEDDELYDRIRIMTVQQDMSFHSETQTNQGLINAIAAMQMEKCTATSYGPSKKDDFMTLEFTERAIKVKRILQIEPERDLVEYSKIVFHLMSIVCTELPKEMRDKMLAAVHRHSHNVAMMSCLIAFWCGERNEKALEKQLIKISKLESIF